MLTRHSAQVISGTKAEDNSVLIFDAVDSFAMMDMYKSVHLLQLLCCMPRKYWQQLQSEHYEPVTVDVIIGSWLELTIVELALFAHIPNTAGSS